MSDRPLRVVVCGTTFGQVYLEGVRRAAPEFELAGILGRGSPRTVRCAERYGVELYGAPDELPADIDIACVVIRSGLLGGSGSQLAQALMERGINVLQEHPLHHDELAACLRAARRAGVVYQLNAFYPHVAPVRRFAAAAQELLAGERPAYVDAACGFQLAYSLLDILGNVLGGVRPWRLAPATASAQRLGDTPFRSLDGEIGGVPATLRIQNQLDPSDPDNHAHVDHRIVIGSEAGNVMLVNTHGPIVLSQRPRYPHGPRDPTSQPHFEGAGAAERRPASARLLGPAVTADFHDIFEDEWPGAVQRALRGVRAAIAAGESPLHRGQYHLSVCLLWQEITAALGPPELLQRASPQPLGAERVGAIARAGGG